LATIKDCFLGLRKLTAGEEPGLSEASRPIIERAESASKKLELSKKLNYTLYPHKFKSYLFVILLALEFVKDSLVLGLFSDLLAMKSINSSRSILS